MVKSSWSADTYFQDCRLWLKSDEMIKEPLRITALEKAFAENFTNQLRKNHFLLGRHYSHLLLAEMNYTTIFKVIRQMQFLEVRNFFQYGLIYFTATIFNIYSYRLHRV